MKLSFPVPKSLRSADTLAGHRGLVLPVLKLGHTEFFPRQLKKFHFISGKTHPFRETWLTKVKGLWCELRPKAADTQLRNFQRVPRDAQVTRFQSILSRMMFK
jgi:hypothetical protein